MFGICHPFPWTWPWKNPPVPLEFEPPCHWNAWLVAIHCRHACIIHISLQLQKGWFQAQVVFISFFPTSPRVHHLLVGLLIQSWSRDNRIDIQVAHSGTPWSIVFEAEVSIEEWCDFPVLLVQAWLFRKGHLSPSWHRGDGRSLWGNNGKHQATIGWIMCLNYWIK